MLAAALLLENGAGWIADRRDPKSSAVGNQEIVSAPSIRDDTLQQSALRQWASIALARPLFSPGRLPFQPIDVPQELPRLAGIVITTEGKTSIFSIGGGTPVIARPGGVVGSFKLLSITADSVRLSGSAGISTLHLAYDTDPAARTLTTPMNGDNVAFPGTNTWPALVQLTSN